MLRLIQASPTMGIEIHNQAQRFYPFTTNPPVIRVHCGGEGVALDVAGRGAGTAHGGRWNPGPDGRARGPFSREREGRGFPAVPRGVDGEPCRERLDEPALGVALCADLVFLEPGAVLGLPPAGALPSPAAILAAGRAGQRALRRVLLGEGAIGGEEAVELGLVHGIVAGDEELPLPLDGSLSALTAARDLLRSRAGGGNGLALEAAAFRLLFAGGDPREGASAFLERRPPRFSREEDHG